jgi:hypothetical protein
VAAGAKHPVAVPPAVRLVVPLVGIACMVAAAIHAVADFFQPYLNCCGALVRCSPAANVAAVAAGVEAAAWLAVRRK